MYQPLRKAYDFITRDLWDMDTGSLGRLSAFAVRSLRFAHVAYRQYYEGQLSMRAMGLVYTTLLSIVPLLAVSFSVLKGFGVHNQVEPVLLRFLAPLGPKAPEISQKIIEFVSNMKVGVLGSVGLALLIYTVISLISKVEGSFNHIWKITTPRSFARRFSDYMSVLLVGPILIFSALGLTATVMSSSVVHRLMSVGPLGFFFFLSGKLLPYVITCAAFTFAYIFIPSVKVKFRPALVGGLFAGILWEISGLAFAKFVVSSTKYSAIYSGFAILIIFMLWVYISWLILLVGASIAFLHQFPQYTMLKDEAIRLSNRLRERMAFSVIYLVGKSYHEGGPAWTLDGLLERLGLPIEPVQELLNVMEKKGLIVRTADDNPGYIPSRDTEAIELSDVLEAVRTADEDMHANELDALSPDSVDILAARMDDALARTVTGITLRDLVTSDVPPPPINRTYIAGDDEIREG